MSIEFHLNSKWFKSASKVTELNNSKNLFIEILNINIEETRKARKYISTKKFIDLVSPKIPKIKLENKKRRKNVFN